MAIPTPRELELAAQLALIAKERDVALQRCAEVEARGLPLAEQIERIVSENRILRENLVALAQRIVGKKSEQLSPDPLRLLLQEMESPGPALGKEYRPKASRTQPPRPARAPRRCGPRLLRRVRLSGRILPRSGRHRAIDHALGQSPVLLNYLEHGEVELDNNACERRIRPTAIRKKNWPFIGHAEAGRRSDITYTVIDSCRTQGIDPLSSLRDLAHAPALGHQLADTGRSRRMTPAT